MEKALVCNRVSRADKISKLRESLRGDTLKLIPEALTMDIYDAWKVLEKAYGKPVRLMKVRKKALLEMSYFPRENGAKGVKGQVEWFIEMESLMQNMLNQAETSMELSYMVYEPELMEKITNKFPLYMALELAKIKGFGKDKFEKVLEQIAEMRSSYQEIQSGRDTKKAVEPVNDSKGGGGAGGGRNRQGQGGYVSQRGNQRRRSSDNHDVPETMLFHKTPIRDENCRVCNTLSANGDTRQLYDNHTSNFPTGCPRYMGMTVTKRHEIAAAAKFCLCCHNPDYVWSFNDKNHKCTTNPRRSGKFVCTENNCFTHLWVCKTHRQKNKDALEKFKQDIKKELNLDFVYVVSIPVASANAAESRRTSCNVDTSPKLSKRQERRSKKTDTNVPEIHEVDPNTTAQACSHMRSLCPLIRPCPS